MLVDFRDRMKLGGEPKPIMVDLSDEKKHPWMFTLDDLTLWTASLFGTDSLFGTASLFETASLFWSMNAGRLLNGCSLWTASFFGRPHSILNAGRRPHSLDGGLIPWTEASFLWTEASLYSERFSLWTASLFGRPHSFLNDECSCSLWTASLFGWPHSILNAGRWTPLFFSFNTKLQKKANNISNRKKIKSLILQQNLTLNEDTEWRIYKLQLCL